MTFIDMENDTDALGYLNVLRLQGIVTTITLTKDRWDVSIGIFGPTSAGAKGETLREATERAYNAYLIAGAEQ